MLEMTTVPEIILDQDFVPEKDIVNTNMQFSCTRTSCMGTLQTQLVAQF